MAIDVAALTRHTRAQIKHLPVVIRFNNVEVDVSYASGITDLTGVEGGYILEIGATMVAAKADFTAGLPRNEDEIELKQLDGTWVTREVESITGVEDANAADVVIRTGSPMR